MPASDETIHQVIEAYVGLLTTGPTSAILELYAEGATVEEPIGSPVKRTRDEIEAFYAQIEPMERSARLITARIGGGEAAFVVEVTVVVDGTTYTAAPLDMMTFDDAGLITSMRAFNKATDYVVG